MIAMLVGAALAVAPGIRAPAEAPAPTPWLVWSGLSSGVRTSGLAGTAEGWVGLSREVAPHLRPELDLGLGYAGGPSEVLTSMRFGLNAEATVGAVTPFAWLAFAHNHESALEAVKRDPLPVALGLSENGVVHRTGAELGGGLRLALGGGAIVGLRLAATALLGEGPAVSLNGLALLGYAF